MAQDTVDAVVKVGGFKAGKCVTQRLPLIGGDNWDKAFFTIISQVRTTA